MRLASSKDREAEIADKAAYWFALLQSDRCSSAQRRACELWLCEAEAHRDAFEALQGTWDVCGDLADDPDILALRRNALSRPKSAWWRNPAIAAALVLALVSGVLLTGGLLESSEPLPDRPLVFTEIASGPVTAKAETAHYVTAVGERSAVVLPDQSEIQLNTDTEIRTRFTESERLIILLKGQAMFDVAHDADRPFSVVASGQIITALGTEFEVRLDADEVAVTLVEGRVSVDEVRVKRAQYESAAEAILDRSQRVELTPGERLQARKGVKPIVTSPDLSTTLGWKEGRVTFNGERLEDAASEMNRYLSRKIVVKQDDLKEMPIGGAFKTGGSRAFVAAIKDLYPVEAAYDPSDDTIKLYWRED